ncbi:MAG: DUF350 domain-containing protein [Magnetococcales bacterium]|nr:DUF350 domain-containing protein [Magnetococcales bacterium]
MKWEWVLFGGGYYILALAFLYIAKVTFDIITPYSLKEEVVDKENPAVSLALTGYLGGVMAVLSGIFIGGNGAVEAPLDAARFFSDLQSMSLFAFAGMAALALAGIVSDRIIMPHFSVANELTEHRNLGVGFMTAATYIGSGIVIAGGLHGSADPRGFVIAFVLGQIFLVGFAFIYRLLSIKDALPQLGQRRNTAVGIAWGGATIAYAIVLMAGLGYGDNSADGWELRLIHFIYYAVLGIILLPISRWVGARFFIYGTHLNVKIIQHGSVGAASIKAGLSILSALALVFSF